MTEEARVLAKHLLRRHEHVCRTFRISAPKDVTESMIRESVINYGSLCELAGLGFLTRGVGKFLGEIADWCYAKEWPPLNALAVNSETGVPGEGYYELSLWPEEVRECISFRGYPSSETI